jgi:hypothetical protein
MIIKRLCFLITCGLYIPVSFISGIGWVVGTFTSSLLSYMIVSPCEYIITGDVIIGEAMIEFWLDYLPELYDEISKKIFSELLNE